MCKLQRHRCCNIIYPTAMFGRPGEVVVRFRLSADCDVYARTYRLITKRRPYWSVILAQCIMLTGVGVPYERPSRPPDSELYGPLCREHVCVNGTIEYCNPNVATTFSQYWLTWAPSILQFEKKHRQHWEANVAAMLSQYSLDCRERHL